MKQTDEDIIAVVQGRIDKKNIQFRPHYSDKDFTDRIQQTAAFDFVDYEYRVKPQPREYWIRKDQAQFESSTAFSNKLMGFDRRDFIKVTEQL